MSLINSSAVKCVSLRTLLTENREYLVLFLSASLKRIVFKFMKIDFYVKVPVPVFMLVPYATVPFGRPLNMFDSIL
jgi:hypothetical protein